MIAESSDGSRHAGGVNHDLPFTSAARGAIFGNALSSNLHDYPTKLLNCLLPGATNGRRDELQRKWDSRLRRSPDVAFRPSALGVGR